MKLGKKQMVLVSFMLFSLFFGAGNLIFPPFLGQNAGETTPLAIGAFLITAVLLPVLGVIVVARFQGLDCLAGKVGPRFAIVFTVLKMCIRDRKGILFAVAAALCLLAGCKDKKLTEYEKGIEKLEQQKYEQAVKHFENAIQKGDKSELAWRGIGIARTGQGAYDKAEEAFVTALGVTEKKQKALQKDLSLYLADAQYHQEDYSGCIETCDQLLESGKEKDAYLDVYKRQPSIKGG